MSQENLSAVKQHPSYYNPDPNQPKQSPNYAPSPGDPDVPASFAKVPASYNYSERPTKEPANPSKDYQKTWEEWEVIKAHWKPCTSLSDTANALGLGHVVAPPAQTLKPVANFS